MDRAPKKATNLFSVAIGNTGEPSLSTLLGGHGLGNSLIRTDGPWSRDGRHRNLNGILELQAESDLIARKGASYAGGEEIERPPL